MRLLRFSHRGRIGFGTLRDGEVCDLSNVFSSLTDVAAVLSTPAGHGVIEELGRLVPAIREGEVVPLAPIEPTSRIFCLSLGYRSHADEAGRQVRKDPYFFVKVASAIIDPFAPIVTPPIAQFLDYEGEIALIIGRGGHQIDETDAMSHVLGVSILNDTTARDLQRRDGEIPAVTDWLSGKSLDGTTPLGPHIVTLDELGTLSEIELRTTLNDGLVQAAKVSEMAYPMPLLVSYLSARVALKPFDVIATGTPARSEGYKTRRLVPGDVVEVSVSGVGFIRSVVA